MKSIGVLSSFLLLIAGLQLTLAQQQGATNCGDIAAALGTTEVAPATGIVMITSLRAVEYLYTV